MYNNNYSKSIEEGTSAEKKSRQEGNALDNLQYFERWIIGKEKSFGNNGTTRYNEVFYQVSEFCITFCFNFPIGSNKSNMSCVIDATENPGEFEHKLNRCFVGLMNLRNQWVEWERENGNKKI